MEPATVIRRAAFNNRHQLFNKNNRALAGVLLIVQNLRCAMRMYEKENFTFVHFISPKMISK